MRVLADPSDERRLQQTGFYRAVAQPSIEQLHFTLTAGLGARNLGRGSHLRLSRRTAARSAARRSHPRAGQPDAGTRVLAQCSRDPPTAARHAGLPLPHRIRRASALDAGDLQRLGGSGSHAGICVSRHAASSGRPRVPAGALAQRVDVRPLRDRPHRGRSRALSSPRCAHGIARAPPGVRRKSEAESR
jgi:hypothetical protein